MISRISHLKRILNRQKVDALVLKSPENITYLTGYPSRDSYFIIVKKGRDLYVTDSRYTAEAVLSLKGRAIQVVQIKEGMYKTIGGLLSSVHAKRIGFEPRAFSYYDYAALKAVLPQSCELVPCAGLVEEMRVQKQQDEIRKIRKAVILNIKAMKFAASQMRPGISELELAAEIERFMRYSGAQGPAFDTIVGSGPNSAYPHHLSSSRKLRINEPVLFDFGTSYQGYKSDLTRVFFLGKIGEFEKRIYGIVCSAQKEAVNNLIVGKKISTVDQAAREYITREGYGGFFGHSTGHGLGLEIHEQPWISAKTEGNLLPGMVFTIEPGIYLPGRFGVRLEDVVLMTRKGPEILSAALKK